MPARLIVNADDFGLTPGINRAIAELHAAGALTSATLMTNGLAFDDAVTIAHAHPTLGIGCHIVLTDGVPVLPPEAIPTLIGPDGRSFRPGLTSFLKALFLGRIRKDEIVREVLAQIEKLQAAGIHVTHVDTHKHTHLFPSIAAPLLEACEALQIPAIRNPFEPAFTRNLRHGTRTRRLAIRQLSRLRRKFESLIHANRIATTGGTLAISATGDLTSATLAEILAVLPHTGTYELCCHPGYNDADLDRVTTRLRAHRNTEREALLNEISGALATPHAARLISYASLTTSE